MELKFMRTKDLHNTILLGDCLEQMNLIEDKSIDMILCDLPYGTTRCSWDEIIPFDELWEQYERVIKDNGAIVLTASQPFTTKLISSNMKMFRYEWIWKKGKHVTGFPNAKRMPMKNHENICVFYKRLPTYNPQGIIPLVQTKRKKRKKVSDIMANTDSLKNEYVTTHKNYPRSILDYSRDSNTKHPTQKPVALFEYLIKTYTHKGEVVLDNCMGSGTTAVACLNTGRKFIGIEKDEFWYVEAMKRIKAMKLS
jgi:site-specific DNA-methyltransferase (adenine-specific)